MLFKKALLLTAVAVTALAAHTERLFSTVQPAQSDILAAQATAVPNHITSNVEGAAFNRFVVIWLENTDFDKAAESDGLHWLAQYGITLDNYWAVTHPSEPNYAAAAGGDYFGIGDDNFDRFPANVSTVADLLDSKSISWGEYQEHMPYAGYDGFQYVNQDSGANDYVRKHNPLMIYDSVSQVESRAANVKNFTTFYEDLENEALPQWMFITPNMTNDGHDTTINVAATWSKDFLEPLLCNEYFMKDTLILLTFDETETYTVKNKVFAVLLGGAVPESLQGTVDSTFYQHYSEISTVEANWDLPHLGRHDVDANVFQFVADKTGVTNVDVDTTNRANNQSYVGWISDNTYDFPAPDVNAINMNGQPILDSIKSVWADAYSSQLNATYFTATTTTSAWVVPDATVDSSYLIQTPSPLNCAVSSSSEFSSYVSSTFESSSAAPVPSAESSQSSSQSSSLAVESSSAAESSAASSSSFIASSSVSSTSSIESSLSSETSASSSSVESSLPVQSSSVSETESESESSSTPSSTSAPEFTGSYNGGHPYWKLSFPGSLGPWSSISISFSKGYSTGLFSFTSGTAAIDGEVSSEATISVTDDSVTIEADFSIETSQEIVFNIAAEILSGSAWTSEAHIVLTSSEGKKFFKRAETTWNLSDTITADASSSDVTSSAGSSEVASTEIISSVLSTSTATQSEESTTVLTVTSCSSNACSETTITTGVTVVTTTESGAVTEYTTYCPLTEETSTTVEDNQSTTVITITSCSDNACSDVAVTTGLTVITSTESGIATEYTTYCPLTGEIATEATFTKGSTDQATEATTTVKSTLVTSEAPAATTESVSSSSSVAVSTFEGKAAGLTVGTTLIGLVLSFLMF